MMHRTRLTTPIVHEHHTEDVIFSLGNANRLTQFVARTDECGHLKLKVQSFRGTERRLVSCRRLQLTVRTHHWCAANDH